MELLNQSISTPTQHHQHNTDVSSIGSTMQHPRQQQPQMSGPYQRPSNGSNILEQHAMRPATTADSSNCVFNDQESSINGGVLQQGNILHRQQSNMMGMSQNQSTIQQHNQVANNNSTRLPSLTLNSSNHNNSTGYVVNSGMQFQNQQNDSRNGNSCHQQAIQSSQQMNQCAYDQTTICQSQSNIAPMSMKEHVFTQQAMNPQQMVSSPRMNTPVLMNQHMGQQQHVLFQQSQKPNQSQQSTHSQNQQSLVIQQNSNSQNHLSMDQSEIQACNRIASFQVNQTSESVSHLSHMDPPPPTPHSMNSISQSHIQQHSSQIQTSVTTHNSNQMIGHSPTNSLSSMGSPKLLPSLSFGSSCSSSISSSTSNSNSTSNHAITNSQQISNQSNIPGNASTTTQLLMALNNNSPISQEQLQEIQNMTCTAPDGSEMLLMQEPRLKQYTSLKEMSTIDLRSECKKRKLSSTGTKIRLSERLASFEIEVLEERNSQLLKEYSHRHQMYEAQAATLKAFQAKKAALQVHSSNNNNNTNQGQNQNFGSREVTSSEISCGSMPSMSQQSEGPPPKKKRVVKPKKSQQQQQQNQEKQEEANNAVNTIVTTTMNSMICNSSQSIITSSSMENNNDSNSGNISCGLMSILGDTNNPSSLDLSHIGNQLIQNSSSTNIFETMNQPESGFFMKDNSCFSHLGSGCRLISTSNSDDNQNFGGTGRAFQAAVPPPPGDSQMTFSQQTERQDFGISEQIGQSCSINLNQQQVMGGRNMDSNQQISQNISNMFNPPVQQQSQPMQHQPQIQLQQQQTQQQNQNFRQQQSQQNFVNGVPQNGLQGSPCVADQAGPSPNMPVSDPTATTSASPVLASQAAKNADVAAEMMDIETMQKLLSPATIRAREELLTQQQTRINELVKLIQKNHDTLREQQMQINLAKKQQKIRQRQNVPPAISLDKQVNSRCLQQALKSRQNFHMLNELSKQQDSIRTAETRLIEQLHINTATDDIARLIKQDGRTALVIVSLLHDYRTTREQNNRAKTTVESAVSDKAVEVTTKKAPARKRNNNSSKVVQNKKAAQQQQQQQQPQQQIQQQQPQQPQQPDIEVVQVIPPPSEPQPQQQPQQQQQQPQNSQQFLEFPQPQVPPRARSQSDVDMEAIFKTVIDASRNPTPTKDNKLKLQKQQQQFDNEVISLPSEGSSPSRAQSQNSVQSVFSDHYNPKAVLFQQHNSPQENTFCVNINMSIGSVSSCSPENVQQTPNEVIQHNLQIALSKQSDIVEILPQIEQNGMEHDMESNKFYDSMIFTEDSNQEYLDQSNQNTVLDFEFPDIDQMVANIRETDPLSCPLDDIDLTAILNSWTDNCDTKKVTNDADQSMGQDVNVMCDSMMFDHQNGSINQMAQFHEDLDWNDYHNQTNIINQAFEQSQI